jgi:hypothetical protein
MESNIGQPALWFGEVAHADAAEEVVSLITRVYIDEGYIDPQNTNGSAITAFLGQEYTTTFEARFGDLLVGTVSVARDGEAGLPMDCIYRDELASFRNRNAAIAEVCQFIVDKNLVRELCKSYPSSISEMDVSLGLLRAAIQHGIETHIEYFVFTINPKHRLFYESMGCVLIGDERSYPSVNEAPALAYALDIQALKQMIAAGTVRNMLLRKVCEGL